MDSDTLAACSTPAAHAVDLATSSSPYNTSAAHSTPATSSPETGTAANSCKGRPQKALEMSIETMEIDLRSDGPDVLEEMNGSPTSSKRKAEAAGSDKDPKKPKLVAKAAAAAVATTPASTKAKDVASTSKATPTPSDAATSLVELKGGKFVVKQKALDLEKALSSMKGRIAFVEFATDVLKDGKAKLFEWPKEHHGFIARLVHESDKTTTALANMIRKKIADEIETSLMAIEDSQEDPEETKEASSVLDRIPTADLKTLLETLGSRTNYGLDVSDFREGLPDGISDIPAAERDRNDDQQALQVWRFEVDDQSLLPEELKTKLERRKQEREQIKSQAVASFFALPESERRELLEKSSSSKRKVVAKDEEASSSNTTGGAVASTSTSVAGGTSSVKKEKKEKKVKDVKVDADADEKKEKKVKKVKVEDSLTAEEKAEAEKLKAEKAAAREAEKAEKEEKKAKKAAVKAEKDAVEEKKRKALSKQAGMLSGFFIKRSASPAVEAGPSSSAAATPIKTKTGDFERVFKPFYVRNDVTVAPTNRFKKAREGKAPAVEINSLETLSREDSLKSFMTGVPSNRVLPINPRPSPFLSVRDVVHAINESQVTGIDANSYFSLLKDRKKVQAKFLKFHEDARPGYVGTWTKTSRVVTPRTPFGKDNALLRYDYDSEEEWEDTPEDADADDVDSLGERSDDEESESGLSDDWMCDDDEVEFEPGHGEEDEMPMDVDGDSDIMIMESATEVARRKVLARERKSKSLKDGAQRKKLTGPLIPVVKGPAWEKEIGRPSLPAFESMKMMFLNDAEFGLDPFKWTSKPVAVPAPTKPVVAPPTAAKESSPQISLPTSTQPGDASSTTPLAGTTASKPKAPAKLAKPMPPHLVASFIEHVQGSTRAKNLLIEELHEKFRSDKVTKKTLEVTLGEIAVKGRGNGGIWEVEAGMKAKYASVV